MIENILKALNEAGTLNSLDYSTSNKLGHEEVKGALNSLLLKEYVVIENFAEDKWSLTTDGEDAVNNGTVEYRIFQSLAEGPKSKDDLEVN